MTMGSPAGLSVDVEQVLGEDLASGTLSPKEELRQLIMKIGGWNLIPRLITSESFWLNDLLLGFQALVKVELFWLVFFTACCAITLAATASSGPFSLANPVEPLSLARRGK